MVLLLAASVYVAIWAIRLKYDYVGAVGDLAWVLGFLAWDTRNLLWLHFVKRYQHFLNGGDFYQNFLLGLILGLLSVREFYIWRTLYQRRQEQNLQGLETGYDDRFEGLGYEVSSNPLKPLVFPCRTTHTRIFPKKHSFSYSYLLIGIPIGWRGSIRSFLSADLKSLPSKNQVLGKAWLSVESMDYLDRGDDVHGLQGKLRSYLQSQDENPADYAYAYLVTAPRFLGYSFNPVSFWYLYDGTRRLKAMILEVNNTFDERRMYFLKDSATDVIEDEGMIKQTTSAKFANTWAKDFHVSPFNSRKGSYSLAALDPFSSHCNSKGPIDNTITLSSSKAHAKLVARIFSTTSPLDPSTFTTWDSLTFFASWWWVGLVTFPRIVREAGKLFFRRKLHVWYRPEVLKESVGRTGTQEERAIALLFRDYLKSETESSNVPLPVKYIPAIPTKEGEEVFTPEIIPASPALSQEILTFKPTTPLFYANLARFTNITTFIRSSLQDPDIKTHTLYTSHPNVLIANYFRSRNHPATDISLISILPWVPIALLRKFFNRQSTNPGEMTSALDDYAVRQLNDDPEKVRAYRRATLKVLVSDCIAFGVPSLIDAVLTIIRIWLCWVCARSLGIWIRTALLSGQVQAFHLGKLALDCLGVHLWCLLSELL